MPGFSADFYIWAKITLASLEDATTREVYLTNRKVDLTNTFYPILIGSAGLELKSGEYLPQPLRGSLTVDNSPGSFENERRFSDLFERETIIDQDVEITIGRFSPGEAIDLSSDGELFCTSVVKSYSISDSQLILDIGGETIERKLMGRTIRRSDFANAPDRSIGKTLPICFADSSEGTTAQVKAIQVDDTSEPVYAYATTLRSENPVGGVQQYYVKDSDGEYVPVDSASATTTEVVTIEAPSASGTESYIWADGDVSISFQFDYPGASNNYILTDCRIRGVGNGAGSTVSGGDLKIRLVGSQEVAGFYFPDENKIYGEAYIDKTEYDGVMNGATTLEFWWNFSFFEPVILPNEDLTLHLVIESTTDGWAAPEIPRFLTEDDTGGAIFPMWTFVKLYGNWYYDGIVDDWPIVNFFGVKMTDTKSSSGDAYGFGAARFTLTQKSGDSATGQTEPDISNLDFVVDIDGIKDDSSGNITGVASAQISRPDHAIEALNKVYNGTSWGGSTISRSEFATECSNLYGGSGDRTIVIGGATRGRRDLRTITEEMCRNVAARVFFRKDGLELYAEGTEQESKATITDKHANILSLNNSGAEGFVINTFQAFCSRRYRETDLITGTAEGDFQDYITELLIEADTDGKWADIIGNSVDLFGIRNLGNQTFNWLDDETSLRDRMELMVRRFVYPLDYVRFEIPLMIEGAFDIDVMELDNGDVVTLLHPDIPAYFGTSSSAKEPSYDGSIVKQGGKHEKRARPVRSQLSSKRLNWNSGRAPSLEFTARAIGKKELT